MALVQLNRSEVNAGMEKQLYCVILGFAVDEHKKAMSLILVVSLCSMEQAMDRSFYSLLSEELPLSVDKCAHDAHMQVNKKMVML